VSFADEVDAVRNRPGTPLRVDVILGYMSDDERAEVEAVLRDKGVPSRPVAEALTKRGHTCSYGAIENWRKARGVVRE
jgi:hypothetical protein